MHSQICTVGGFGRAPEATLFLRAQMGCRESVNTLMARHDGLVHAVVRRQVLGDLPFAEALQAGRIGLWRAVQGYDPLRGTAFSTYAWPCIMRQVWRVVKAHRREQERTASQEMLWLPQVSEDPFHHLEQEAIYQTLHTQVRRLPPRLRTIIVARYGLDGSAPLTYRQLGILLGLSGERARQPFDRLRTPLHTEALVWLRHPAHSQRLRSLLGRHTLADYQQADTLAQQWLRQRGGRHDH
jgi:RNA polymerase sigma factor (sigma-70 family)